MPEPTYTLTEARAELARQECRAHGHDYEHVETARLGGGRDLTGVFCPRCGRSWPIAAIAHNAPTEESNPRTHLRIDAVRWTGDNPDELRAFAGVAVSGEPRFLLPNEITGVWEHPHVYNESHDVWLPVQPGQWVIRDGAGGLYPIHADAAVAAAEQARAELRIAIARMVRSYFAAVDDPLYEDVRILCGRIERGEHA